MVMFREDEQRMIAAERAARPRWLKRLRLAVKILFYTGCLFFFSLFVLSTLGGKGDALKKGLEQYLIQATGMVPEVGALNGVTFFPIMSMNADDIALYKMQPNVKPVKDMPLPHGARTASVKHIAVHIAFWDMFFSRRLIRDLDIKDLRFESGSIDARALSFTFIKLDPKGYKAGPAIISEGKYGDVPVKAMIQMERKGRSYGIAKDAEFDAIVGKLHFAGTLQKAEKGALWAFTAFGSSDVTGDMVFYKTSKTTDIKANLHRQKSTITFDMTMPPKGEGQATLKIPMLNITDAAPLIALASQISALWPDSRAVKEFMVDTAVADLQADGKSAGTFSFRLRKTASILSASDFAGTINVEQIARNNGQSVTVHRDGLNLMIPVRPECMQGTFAVKSDSISISPLVMASPNGRLAGTGRIGGQSFDTNVKPVPGTGCVP